MLGQAPAFWTNLPLFGYQCTARQAAAWMQFGGSLVLAERCQAELGSGTSCHQNCALAVYGFMPMRWYLKSWGGAKV